MLLGSCHSFGMYGVQQRVSPRRRLAAHPRFVRQMSRGRTFSPPLYRFFKLLFNGRMAHAFLRNVWGIAESIAATPASGSSSLHSSNEQNLAFHSSLFVVLLKHSFTRVRGLGGVT